MFSARVLAVMIAEPGATPVIGTVALVAFVANATDAGTVATVVSLETRLIVRPAGGGTDRFSLRSCVAVPVMFVAAGTKAIVAPTFTNSLPDEYPVAVARTLVEPKLTPVT